MKNKGKLFTSKNMNWEDWTGLEAMLYYGKLVSAAPGIRQSRSPPHLSRFRIPQYLSQIIWNQKQSKPAFKEILRIKRNSTLLLGS